MPANKVLRHELKKRRYNLQRIRLGVIAFGGVVILLFYDAITNWLSHRATDVTSKSLGK